MSKFKKNIFITGAKGFIGRNLQEYLQDKFNIFAPSHEELELTNAEQVSQYIFNHNINIIIHCAAYGAYKEDSHKDQNLVFFNLRMFFNLVRNLNKVEKIIHFGSGAEYDKTRDLVKIKEEDFDKQVPRDDYGFYKYICSKYIEKSEKIICLRLFGVYGKYEDHKFIPNAIIKNFLKQDIIINQNIIFSYLFIDDLISIVDYFIFNNARFKAYNVVPDELIDLISVSNIINDISDYNSKIIVLKNGLSNQYTADNSRLKNEISNIKFINNEEAIKKLFIHYKKIITNNRLYGYK